ncbi:MAG TPA: site-specific integrase [Terriglobales bacterium]|nr:site-specific integrase [Terriglobales bacterium]
MSLYKRGDIWHYDFMIAGCRYRGSTHEATETRARKIESMLMAEAAKVQSPIALRRSPLLADFAPRFLRWVENSALEANTKRYYNVGWARLQSTCLPNLPINRINSEEVDAVKLDGAPAWVNQALRTLRRMLGKAMEWKLLAVAPRIRLRKEYGREDIIDAASEAKLLANAKQPLRDVLIIMQDCGARPEEVFRIRVENINWNTRTIFNPHGKTRKARRHLPISDRMMDLLLLRCGDRKEGWLFPSKRAECGHLTTVAKQFREARATAGLPNSLVLYCARHTFGTTAYAATGNLAAVMDAMGHQDVRTTIKYQHQDLGIIREAINLRNLRHKERHSGLMTQ